MGHPAHVEVRNLSIPDVSVTGIHSIFGYVVARAKIFCANSSFWSR